MKKKIMFSTWAVLLSIAAFSQSDDSVNIRKIINETMSNGKAYENLRYLCKKIGARLSGSSNAEKAVFATVAMLKEAGADTVYLQPCIVPHWIRGEKESGYIQLPGNEKYQLHLCALGNSVGSVAEGVTATVIEVKSMQELHTLGEKAIKGKIVFFNIEMNPNYINTFRAYGENGIGRRIGPAQAAKYGAIGVLVRSLASNPDDYPHTGWTGYNDSFPKIPAVAISTNDANLLSSKLKIEKNISVWFKTSCKMLPDIGSFNVIGEIRGTQFPGEIITVGGHLDSWDLAEGAHDNGAGCVQSIEVIRSIKSTGLKPKRTIRAVMFMNEENGSGGSKAYFNSAKEKNENHVFALESDAGGYTPRGFAFEGAAAKIDKIKRWRNLFYEYGVYDFDRSGSGSDIEPLKGLGATLAGLSPDSQRYFEVHHAATDVFEAVSRRELHLGAANMGALIWMVSEYGL